MLLRIDDRVVAVEMMDLLVQRGRAVCPEVHHERAELNL